MTEQLPFHFSLSWIGEGNGNPLQCSCLENPRDGGAWWASVYGVTPSPTRLKWLSSSSSRTALTHDNQGPSSSSMFTDEVSSIAPSVGLDKSIISLYYNDIIIMSFKVFSLLIKTSVLCVCISLLTPGNHWSFYCLHSFTFSRMSFSWNLFFFFSFSLTGSKPF